ncbi:MAG TPA: class E sortase [Egibacteraceae bacterium]|nr:class E sortase [Egibacteraceae bacterium]
MAGPAMLTRALRYGGWTLIAAGFVVLLYLAYSLFFTNVATGAAQAELSEQWQRQVVQTASVGRADRGLEATRPRARDRQSVAGGAVAVLEFSRPGSAETPVHAGPLYVVPGVTQADLTRGPGRYPETAEPGEEGNLAIAGHRTTYGAPFFHLDQLVAGDEVHVTGLDGERHTYRVVRQEVVAPSDVWVIEEDPLESGAPTLTLTTCHPRFSAAQRLVVFAELVA